MPDSSAMSTLGSLATVMSERHLASPARPKLVDECGHTTPDATCPNWPWVSTMLVLELTSVGLGLWAWRHPDVLLEYARHNAIPVGLRLVKPVATALVSAGVGVVVSLLVGVKGAQAKRGLHSLAQRSAPLILVSLLAVLFNWRLWLDRELPHLLFALTIVALAKSLVACALRAPPFPAPATGAWSRLVHATTTARDDLAAMVSVLPRQLPLIVVCAAALGYTAFFSYVTVVHHRNVLSASLDLGLEDNLVWNVLHRARLFKSSPLGGPDASHLGFHATWFSFVIAPFYALRPNAESLLIIQAFLFGSAALPLYLLGTRYVSRWVACFVALSYVLYPGLHGSNLYDFHYLPLGCFFLWFAVYFTVTRRWILAGLLALFALSVREDVAVGLAGLGGLLLLTGRRTVAGTLLLFTGAAYFLVMKGVIMHHAMGGGDAFVHQYKLLIPAEDNSFAGVVKTIISNPIYTLDTLLERQKLVYLLQIMLPFAFLPLRKAIGLWAALTGFVFTLLSTRYTPQIQISFQYTAYWSAQLFPAVLVNLQWIDRTALINGKNGLAWKWSWLAAFALGTLATSYQYGALLQQNTAWGGFGPYHFGTDATDLARRANVQKLLALIPPAAKVAACENVVPQLSNRPNAYTLRLNIYDADYVLFRLPAPQFERENVLEVLQSRKFGIVQESGEFVLAKRGHPTTGNLRIIMKMGGHGLD
jgi:uncharacterized membrane protein